MQESVHFLNYSPNISFFNITPKTFVLDGAIANCIVFCGGGGIRLKRSAKRPKMVILGPKNAPFCSNDANLPHCTCFTRLRGGGCDLQFRAW